MYNKLIKVFFDKEVLIRMMTNLNKTKEEIIYELVLSLNQGNCRYAEDRVEIAMAQYAELVEERIIVESK